MLAGALARERVEARRSNSKIPTMTTNAMASSTSSVCMGGL
jgi:hypothetical protein